MIHNIKVLFICSEDPRSALNGVTAALNSCYRVSTNIFTYFDIYIHSENKYVISSSNVEVVCSFREVELNKYNIFFLSPVNIAFRYLFYSKEIRQKEVYSFLSDPYSYALLANFYLGIKFRHVYTKYILKFPLIYFKEKYIDWHSKNIALQTQKDVRIFSRFYFSRKGFLFPNIPVSEIIEKNNFSERVGIGWIASCSVDYFPLTKWVFDNILVKVLLQNPDFKLHIHSKNYEILKTYIHLNYSDEFNITYTDYVSDISSFYNTNKVILSPVYKGYGLINRTIEAMYHGCVVVGDRAAFNGISGAEDGTNCFVAKNKFDFVEKIEHAYVSKNMDIISNNAKNVIKSNFDMDKNIKNLTRIINC